ncbi:GspH/FimT family pseudopilin [Pseudomonas otitidis]|uniref:pilus assembly FimT family protein n=1 Tax=Metapseudomonas otitidis TaxID=319939 RepID=UPI001428D422|nr:GspH/FimT family pseudopilin [Pseudomonas otitidis]MDI6526067.1 GspH/FimT family pseudopilin [Pseudomonas otitidis]
MQRIKKNGFTLVEMLVVVTLLAIFAALAIPGFGDFMRNNRLMAAADEFRAMAEFARMEAATRGGQVTLAIAGGEVSVSRNGVVTKKAVFPSKVTVSKNIGSTVYSLSGGSSQAMAVIFCEDNDLASAFKVMVEKNGRVRIGARGKDETGQPIASCSL